ncbi:MAG: site-2 protease family protein [Desulfovibrio sp.]|nr:site-2 protease family protein [Desulfovibrio sp.]
MFDFDLHSALRMLAVALVPAMLGIILHEVAHGWVARLCGDHTAESQGRLTLNPLPHIDPLGLAVFGLTSVAGSFVFGWAKPVPVDPRNFRDAKRDMALVSIAGPATNFLLAIAFGVLLWAIVRIFPYAEHSANSVYNFALQSCQAGVLINFGLGWLNLMPVPPLDGSKILAYFLPRDLAWRFLSWERYGFVIFLLLLFTGILGNILGPLIRYSAIALLSLLGFN